VIPDGMFEHMQRRPRRRLLVNVLIGVGVVASTFLVPLIVRRTNHTAPARTVTWSANAYTLRTTTRGAIDAACAAKAKRPLPGPVAVDVRGGAGVAVYEPANGRLVCAFLIDAPAGPTAAVIAHVDAGVSITSAGAAMSVGVVDVDLAGAHLRLAVGSCELCGP
jgi:hypothetical protein